MTIFHVVKYGHLDITENIPLEVPKKIRNIINDWHKQEGFWMYYGDKETYAFIKKKGFKQLLFEYED
jgi:hypothetical protein